jgi:hypothetical protein
MSMRRQREYGMSSAGMRLRPVDSSLHTMGLFSEPWLRLTKIISTVKVQSFVSYATGWEWESRIFCYWMKNAAVREFSYFSLVSVMEGACFLVIFFLCLLITSSRPNGSARFPLFFFLFL